MHFAQSYYHGHRCANIIIVDKKIDDVLTKTILFHFLRHGVALEL